MTEVQKQFVTKIKVLKLGGMKAYRGWKELCGGYDNIGVIEVDFKNFVRDIKTYIGNFDVQMFVENLIGEKDTCSSFYFDFIVDENKCLAGVFWADPICIKNYMLFGEVLSVDATYATNKYDMVFVPFTGVNHHKRCITFGAGLIGDESIECYRWLFKTFLEAMGGFLTPHLTLVEFWICYESALEVQRHKQPKLNSDTKHSEIPRKTNSNLEVYASEIYSQNIFKDFQTELVAALSDCHFKDVKKIDETKIYILTDLQMPNKSWNVAYSPDNMEITCSCSMFQRMGLLCD
ncbi:protein FAR1-RELATED SEQUENCE 5-like [Silene latifolia]|uniref:protein FAR1-RELATED SEQUENCE 5-like n=1 Tax=Silene latifolia TaxID=37657 RepID=UPI003D76F2CE